jgi:proteasome accessory factor C
VNEAIATGRVLELHYYKENEDQFNKRLVEPHRLQNGTEGWYVVCWDLNREAVRHFRLDRIKEATLTEDEVQPRLQLEEMAGSESWLERGEVEDAHVARVWVSPERARWVREDRTIVEELADGALIAELPYAGVSWLLREILRGAGDLVVLEPEEARAAVAEAVAEQVEKVAA